MLMKRTSTGSTVPQSNFVQVVGLPEFWEFITGLSSCFEVTSTEPWETRSLLVFGTKGYAMTWAQRTERFGIMPETFQAALAKGVPAIRLGPGAQTVVEEAKEKA
jgi:hypothetical protein